jgi:hypothetical protein
VVHRDQVTGVDRVFVGTTAGIWSGVYDPAAPGSIRWDPEPELRNTYRPMAFAVAHNVLHVAIKPELLVRIDGPEPRWQTVLSYPFPPFGTEGLRGLTTIPSPSGIGEVILTAIESTESYIVRVAPAFGYSYQIEVDIRVFLRGQWGSLGFPFVIAAYNDMPGVIDPRTGETVHLIGLLAFAPAGPLRHSSWYLVRRSVVDFRLGQVPMLPNPHNPDPPLQGTRSIVVSPFAQDEGRFIYVAGYDALGLPAHNSAWIYRVPLERFLGEV